MTSRRFKNFFTTLIFENSINVENLLGSYPKIFCKFTLLPCQGSFALELKNSISPYRIRLLNYIQEKNGDYFFSEILKKNFTYLRKLLAAKTETEFSQ